jgi:hypothetical protein
MIRQNKNVSGFSDTTHVPGRGVCNQVPTSGTGVIILPLEKFNSTFGSIGGPDRSGAQNPNESGWRTKKWCGFQKCFGRPAGVS